MNTSEGVRSSPSRRRYFTLGALLGASVAFVLAPHWYPNTISYALAGAAVLIGAAALYRVRVRSLRAAHVNWNGWWTSARAPCVSRSP